MTIPNYVRNAVAGISLLAASALPAYAASKADVEKAIQVIKNKNLPSAVADGTSGANGGYVIRLNDGTRVVYNLPPWNAKKVAYLEIQKPVSIKSMDTDGKEIMEQCYCVATDMGLQGKVDQTDSIFCTVQDKQKMYDDTIENLISKSLISGGK